MRLPRYEQQEGNAGLGYQYMLNGELFSSGLPYPLYKTFFETRLRKALSLAGFNPYEINGFTIFGNEKKVATPGCLNCHGQVFDGKMVIGLGNSYSQFQNDYSGLIKPGALLIKILYGKRSEEWKNAKNMHDAGLVVSPRIVLEMQGPNPAHRIAHVMAAHRDPVTLAFRPDTLYFELPEAVVPTDIPALWLAKKKNAWTADGIEQGSAAKQFMIATILTLKDTTEAAKIYTMMKDVWAYLKTLEPPAYPYAINKPLADEGKRIFNTRCSGCHGTYGKDGHYPNKLIPERIIGTDSMLLKYFNLYKGYEDWFNKSWFATAYEPAYAKANYGYVAPPLDGIWITAPYFHNGSVPTLEAVLNSKIRPRYWKRNFDRQQYDYKTPGWKYKSLSKPGGKKTYNTDIPGYGNYGHYFGDKLTDSERKAVIEYLKML